MKTEIKYIGIDVAKCWLDVDLPKPASRVENTPEAIARALKDLPENAHLVCESTGGYEAALMAAAWEAGVAISVVPPQRVRQHARSTGKLAKTDRLDAQLLSAYGRMHEPRACLTPSAERQCLRELLRARAQLLELKKTETSWDEHPAQHPLLREQAKARLQQLDAQLAELQREIRSQVAKSQPVCAELERLQQVQGVGEVTAWTVWAEMPELGQLEPGQAAALAGLAPHPRDSGTTRGKRFILHGRPQIRRVLYMAAVTACRFNPVLRPFYQNLRSRGKPAKLALIAVARRLIELLNLLLKNPHFCLVR